MKAGISRRTFAAGTASLGLAGACASGPSVTYDGSFAARPGAVTFPDQRRGEFRFDAWPRPLVYVPESLAPGAAAPMILVLHGGGSDAECTLRRMLAAARREGVVLLAPDARAYTWDAIRTFRERPGRDVARIFGDDTGRVEAALQLLFNSYPVDPARVAIAGFSDGASYALSLGPRNAGLFTHIMGFSPGGVVPFTDAARARVFISHGRQDPMLSYDNSEEGIVPGFRASGFDVTFETFTGVHAFRDQEIDKAMAWFLRG
jgi:phospholipase/carboxylesterase